MEYITYKHSFNSGDLITVLPGIRHLSVKNNKKAVIYQRLDFPGDYGHNDFHPVRDKEGRQVCMNKKMFDMMKPLLEAQDYIAKFEIWEGQPVDFDFDLTRHHSQMPMPGGDIHKWPSLIFPQLECSLDAPWIEPFVSVRPDLQQVKWADYVGAGDSEYILINRTDRYQNPYITYFFLKEFQHKVVFVGTKDEAKSFCSQWGVLLPTYEANDFERLASIIKHCKFFIGNQSLCWHIADAMKVPRILEVCSQYPNTFPTGADGYSFITQNALEFQFNKLLNKKDA